jgi:methylated-DNA-protein-cysteine methyltransferase related protein
MTDAAAAILAVVARVPRGRVATYGTVATIAGWPRRARLVGRVLSELPPGSRIPWHRVLAAGGRSAFAQGSDARERQFARLRREGVDVSKRRIDLRRYGWPDAHVDLDRWLWRVGDEN